MADKILKTRISLPYKNSTDWDLTFVPLKGEVCWHSFDDGSIKSKVGDGLTRLGDLEFATEPLNSKADLDSPEFIGIPKAPTPASDDNSTQIATTEFVKQHTYDISKEEFDDAIEKVNTLNNTLLDKVLDSYDPTIGQQQDGCAISASYTYGTGNAYVKAGMSLMRYQVNPGDKIKISGVAPAISHAVWMTANGSAFSNLMRKGPIITTASSIVDRTLDITLTIATGETYLFVSKTSTLEVKVLGEVVEGKITKLTTQINANTQLLDDTYVGLRDHLGVSPIPNEAAHASFEFLERIRPYIPYNYASRAQAHMCYCIPDLHRRFECLDAHRTLFANSYSGTAIDSSGQSGIYNLCKVIVTAGDLLYSGGAQVTSREDLIGAIETFVGHCKLFASYGTNIFPVIGGHDFNEYSNAQVGHDNKKVGENLTKSDQRKWLIDQCITAAKYGVTKFLPASASGNVEGLCYYYVRDNTNGDYYIMLDECDHPNFITGTYNGETVKWKLTGISWTTSKFNATSMDGATTYTNIPFGDFEYVYSRYKSVSYSQEQLTWLINILKNAPAGTHFWFFNHSGVSNELADNSGARDAIAGIIRAYANRTTYNASGNSTAGDMPWSVDVDFTGVAGTVVGLFRGHSHKCEVVDRNGFKEFTSDTPGNYSSSVKAIQIGLDTISGDLFHYKDEDDKCYRYHFGRRYPGIDDVPTIEEKYTDLLARVEALEDR